MSALKCTNKPTYIHLNETQHSLPTGVYNRIVSQIDHSRFYCEMPQYHWVNKLKESLGEKHCVPTSNITLGNGSNEILAATIHMLSNNGYKNLITFVPTHESVLHYCEINDVQTTLFNLQDNDFEIDYHKFGVTISQIKQPTIVYIANPNNPVGTVFEYKRLKEWILYSNLYAGRTSPVMWIIDEAYIEFSGCKSAIDLIGLGNVIVTRTFSKLYQLAGFRIGYSVSNDTTSKHIRDYLAIDDLNMFGVVGAWEALQPQYQQHYETIIKDTNDCRIELCNFLQNDCNIQTALPTEKTAGNFVFAKFTDEQLAKLTNNNIIISRAFDPYCDNQWRRITVGHPSILEQIKQALS